MSRVEQELLQDLKDYLGDDYEAAQESALLFCIKRAIRSFKSKRNYPDNYSENRILKDMEKYYSCIWDDLLYWFNMQGIEFQTNHSESGTSRSWKSEDEIYVFHGVIPIARII